MPQLVTRRLREVAGPAPALLVVDDAQLLDDHSAAVVLALVTGAVCRTVATVGPKHRPRTHEARTRLGVPPGAPGAPGASGIPGGPVPAVLTRREREIARMAAEGLTDREIAEALVVSVRTVESHLAAAYRKLGIRSRRELAALLTTG